MYKYSSTVFVLLVTAASASAFVIKRQGAATPNISFEPNPKVTEENVSTASRLHIVAQDFQTQRNRPMFTIKELCQNDEALASELQTAKEFEVPKTWIDTVETFLGQSSMQFIIGALLSTILLRSLQGPLVAMDLGVIVLTGIAWYIQEWLVHHNLFHGNDGSSIHPFEYHDWHHDMPYFHIATDSLQLCATWFAAVSAVTGLATSVLGVPTTLALDTLATYTFFGLTYETFHYLAHTKVPLKGWLQKMRQNHVFHHLEPTSYLSMNPAVDNIMGSSRSD